MKRYIKNYFILTFILVVSAQNNILAQPSHNILTSGELQIALQKLNTLGSVLYVAAHPDDENTAAITYFSRGRKYRTAYLAVTRGDGGQNLIGPEKGAEMGVIRTQELLEARRRDGGEQFFTRAIDFGYSKTLEETLQIWGKDQILSDVVWVIRKFRPDVIMTGFPVGRPAGHGNHTASASLAREAYDVAADPNRFTDQLNYVDPWRAKRIVYNARRFRRDNLPEGLVSVDPGTYDPFLGKSYTEISAESRSMHKSQGFGAVGSRGTRKDYFQHVAGDEAKNDIFDGVDTSWDRVPGGNNVGQMISEVLTAFNPENPSLSIPGLLEVKKEIDKLENSYWVELKKKELLQIIQASAGLWMETVAGDYSSSPGGEVSVRTTLVNRSGHDFKLDKIAFGDIVADVNLNKELRNNEPVSIDKKFRLPDNYATSQPYWLREKSSLGTYAVADPELIGNPENKPAVSATITLSTSGHTLEYNVPVLYRWRDRVDGELYRPYEVRPAVTVNLEDKVRVFPDDAARTIDVKVKAQAANTTGEVRLNGPSNWKVEPASVSFSLENKYQEQIITFTVTPPVNQDEAVLVPEAIVNGQRYTKGLVEIAYPHIERQTLFPESQVKAIRLNITKVGSKIGYIDGAGDEIPQGLRNLGYEVTFLDDKALEDADFSQYDAIVAGVRAYNTRGRLLHTRDRLLKYVEDGGTLIVQYNVAFGLVTQNIGPYPFTIGRGRITVEEAPLSFVDANHQLLNFPNKITQDDLDGWVQERGLYFAEKWDDKYETILTGNDPNEAARPGGMLFARHGKGVFIYSGYSWFRQLPAGVPGAYRLFVNLISAGKRNGN